MSTNRPGFIGTSVNAGPELYKRKRRTSSGRTAMPPALLRPRPVMIVMTRSPLMLDLVSSKMQLRMARDPATENPWRSRVL